MNTAFGSAEELPFDLRHRRWPICYELAEEDHETIRKTRKHLGEQIEMALRSAMGCVHQAVEDASRRLSAENIMVMGRHAHHDLFWNDRSSETVIQVAAMGFVDRTYDRLLDLKLIDCVFVQERKRFVYRWTYLGKLVLKKVHIKSALSPFDSEKSTGTEMAAEDLPKETRRRFQEMSFRERLLCAVFPGRLTDH
jgi:hypothetical protein